jgi:methionine-rich copper-binding protein CopC
VKGVSRVKKLSNFLILGFLITLLGIAPSSAHTSLVASTPKIDSKLPTAPQAISLQFDEDLLVLGDNETNRISVVDIAKHEYVARATRVIGSIASAELNSNEMRPGLYTVSYRVVSGDGHVVTSSYQFEVQGNENESIKTGAVPSMIRTTTQSPKINTTSDGTSSPESRDSVSKSSGHDGSHQTFFHQHASHIAYVAIGLLTILIWVLLRKFRN